MDYTEQFIRLNCSLMSDYKMMKLNAEMKCMGIGLYIQMILFLRRQQEYKHDFNELDLLAEQWGATVENLQHLIKDFNLFVIMEDGYFRCLYLDEVMGYQNKLSEQRAAAGSKGGRSSKKKTAQIAEKVITSTVLTAADKEANDDAGNKENNTESNAENSVKCMKNTIEKSDDENVTENTLQCIDNECVNRSLQASFKQNFIREEKNREEKKKKDDVNIIQRNIGIGNNMFFCYEKNVRVTPRQKRYINEIFPIRVRADTPRTIPDLEERGVHKLIFQCCKAELMTNNYFHAVFESSKALIKRIQDISSVLYDGQNLIEHVFRKDNPILIINNYQTRSEKDEHNGFKSILIGICNMFRNPEAHELKTEWIIEEQDALDILSMISYCHRRLDKAQKINI